MSNTIQVSLTPSEAAALAPVLALARVQGKMPVNSDALCSVQVKVCLAFSDWAKSRWLGSFWAGYRAFQKWCNRGYMAYVKGVANA